MYEKIKLTNPTFDTRKLIKQAFKLIEKSYNDGFEYKKAGIKLSNFDFTVEEAPRRPGDGASLVANVDKIHAHTKWRPRYNNLELIIQHAYDWEKGDVLASWKS